MARIRELETRYQGVLDELDVVMGADTGSHTTIAGVVTGRVARPRGVVS